MDSKVVAKEIRDKIRPGLKAAGFSKFTSRVAWRYAEDQIHVLEFCSFNKYNADVLGITTFSFSVNLGMYPLFIPATWPPKVKEGKLIPSEPECPFRGSLERSFSSDVSNPSIWPIDKKGKNLHWCIQDVLNKLPEALSWYDQFKSRENILEILMESSEIVFKMWGFGNNPSPIRSYLCGYTALALNQEELAREKLSEAVKSNCFVNLFSSVEGAVNRAL